MADHGARYRKNFDVRNKFPFALRKSGEAYFQIFESPNAKFYIRNDSYELKKFSKYAKIILKIYTKFIKIFRYFEKNQN